MILPNFSILTTWTYSKNFLAFITSSWSGLPNHLQLYKLPPETLTVALSFWILTSYVVDLWMFTTRSQHITGHNESLIIISTTSPAQTSQTFCVNSKHQIKSKPRSQWKHIVNKYNVIAVQLPIPILRNIFDILYHRSSYSFFLLILTQSVLHVLCVLAYDNFVWLSWISMTSQKVRLNFPREQWLLVGKSEVDNMLSSWWVIHVRQTTSTLFPHI